MKIYEKELQNRLQHESETTEYSCPVDVVILDYKMPEIDGIEVA